MLQRYNCPGRESSQERDAVVEARDDERLDQELSCFPHEERPDPADVVGANLQDRAIVMMLAEQQNVLSRTTPRFLAVGDGDTAMFSTVTSRSV